MGGGRRPGQSIWDDGRPTPQELGVVDWLLTTTRSNRRTLDLQRPVPPEVIEECLEIALQAPTAHNDQRWHFVVVTDPDKRAMIADAYRWVWDQVTRGERRKLRRWQGASQDHDRVQESADWLPKHLADVPVHVIPCMVGPRHNNDLAVSEWARHMEESGEDPGLGESSSPLWVDAGYFASVYPAVWSFQLALRSRGLGSVLTIAHLAAERRVARELGLPESVVQTCLVPVAYVTRTTFSPARRAPLETRLSWNGWQGVR